MMSGSPRIEGMGKIWDRGYDAYANEEAPANARVLSPPGSCGLFASARRSCEQFDIAHVMLIQRVEDSPRLRPSVVDRAAVSTTMAPPAEARVRRPPAWMMSASSTMVQ